MYMSALRDVSDMLSESQERKHSRQSVGVSAPTKSRSSSNPCTCRHVKP